MRRALHLSHNCHTALVDSIYFQTWLPEDDNHEDYVEHIDSNGSCRVSGDDYLCTTVLTSPKTESSREPGQDDAWLLPGDYNDGDYPWRYFYNVYLAAPGDNDGT